MRASPLYITHTIIYVDVIKATLASPLCFINEQQGLCGPCMLQHGQACGEVHAGAAGAFQKACNRMKPMQCMRRSGGLFAPCCGGTFASEANSRVYCLPCQCDGEAAFKLPLAKDPSTHTRPYVLCWGAAGEMSVLSQALAPAESNEQPLPQVVERQVAKLQRLLAAGRLYSAPAHVLPSCDFKSDVLGHAVRGSHVHQSCERHPRVALPS